MPVKFKVCSERLNIQDSICLMDDVFFGNFTVSNKKEKYLTQFPSETEEQYKSRKNRTIFYNFTKPIVRRAAESSLSGSITFSEDFPSDLEYLKENFDGKGKSLFNFSFDVLNYSLRHGSCGVIPDYDSVSNKVFARIVPLEDIIGAWRSGEESDGTNYLSRVQFVVRSTYVETVDALTPDASDTFEEYESLLIYELIHPNILKIYNVINVNDYKNENATIKGIKSIPEYYTGELIKEKKLKGFDRIPFHLFVSGDPVKESSVLENQPPFYDISIMNINHYNKKSDQDNIMSVSKFAIIAGSGVGQDDLDLIQTGKDTKKTKIGPFTMLLSSKSDSKWYYVEHSGAAIQSGADDLLKLEKDMMTQLKDYLQKEVFIKTATESNLQEQDRQLFSNYLAQHLEKVISNVVKDFLIYVGKNSKDYENVDQFFSLSRSNRKQNTEKKIDAIIKARQLGDLSLSTFLKELDSLDVFSDNFNYEEEEEKVEVESAEQLKQEMDRLKQENINNKEDEEDENEE